MDNFQGLVSTSSMLVERASAVAAAAVAPLASPAHLTVIRDAQVAHELSAQVLELSVQHARDVGHTWQEIGDLLGVTRQAAFQRFGKPIDPRTGEPMDKTVRIPDAGERATRIVTQVLNGDMNEARKSFNAEVLAAFTDEVRGNGLATVAGLVGAFERVGDAEPFVRRIADHDVVDVPLHYEAGDMKARVAFDADEKVAGLLILPPETP